MAGYERILLVQTNGGCGEYDFQVPFLYHRNATDNRGVGCPEPPGGPHRTSQIARSM